MYFIKKYQLFSKLTLSCVYEDRFKKTLPSTVDTNKAGLISIEKVELVVKQPGEWSVLFGSHNDTNNYTYLLSNGPNVNIVQGDKFIQTLHVKVENLEKASEELNKVGINTINNNFNIGPVNFNLSDVIKLSRFTKSSTKRLVSYHEEQ